MLLQGVWQPTGCFLVAFLGALYCSQCYLTSSSTTRTREWTTTGRTVTDDTWLEGSTIQSNLSKLEKWAARNIVKSDKDKWEISYMELINLMQQHRLGLDCQVCRNRPECPGGQQMWVRSAPLWLAAYQSALGECSQQTKRSDFSHWCCTWRGCIWRNEPRFGLPNAKRWVLMHSDQPVGDMWHDVYNLWKILIVRACSVKMWQIGILLAQRFK